MRRPRASDIKRLAAVEDLIGCLLIESAGSDATEYELSLAAGWIAACEVVIFGDSMLLLALPKDGKSRGRKVIAAMEDMLTAAVSGIRPELRVMFLEGVS